jgi:glutathione S-transferase
MLTLYFAPNTCALASYFALAHARADFRAERVDFASGQQRAADYLRLNPLGRVPALATPRGV